jgi:hypothetical protein
VLAACGNEPRHRRTEPPPLASIQSVVTWHRDLTLEENQHVINVSPWVSADSLGTFLVADGMEQQLRSYAPDGRLRHTFGRRGSGPGEFQHLTRATRLSDGTILAPDMMGQVTRFGPEGSRVVQTTRSGLGPIYDVAVLDDSSVAIVGRKGGRMDSPLIHVWDLGRGRIVRSFFPAPQGPRGFASAYAFTGFADVAVRGDTLATIFALEDTVRLFLRDGREAGKIPVRFGGFHPIEQPLSPNLPPDQFQRWLGSFSTVTDLFWLRSSGFLVQYMDQHGSDRTYSLLRMDRHGRKLWEVAGSPRLLAVTPQDSLVFVKPGAEAPNTWSIAALSAVR